MPRERRHAQKNWPRELDPLPNHYGKARFHEPFKGIDTATLTNYDIQWLITISNIILVAHKKLLYYIFHPSRETWLKSSDILDSLHKELAHETRGLTKSIQSWWQQYSMLGTSPGLFRAIASLVRADLSSLMSHSSYSHSWSTLHCDICLAAGKVTDLLHIHSIFLAKGLVRTNRAPRSGIVVWVCTCSTCKLRVGLVATACMHAWKGLRARD